MKILFIHLSDWHIYDKQAINEFQIQKMIDSVNCIGDFDRAILIISGDIAYSGLESQYKHAKRIVGTIIKAVRDKSISRPMVDVLCVPGNHDIDYGDKPRTHAELQDIFKNRKYEQSLSGEIEKQHSFFDFSTLNGCFKSSKTFDQRIINYDGYTIEANLINTGIFSLRDDEDKALHFIPQSNINSLVAPTNADFVITVMHHAPEWYTDAQKHDIERAIFDKSSIVFHGHEHYQTEKKLSSEHKNDVLVQSCGALCNNSDWSKSSYFIGVLDTETNCYLQKMLSWNPVSKQYEPSSDQSYSLIAKPSIEKQMLPTDEYVNGIISDKFHSISSDFRDYYVFPRIKAEDISGKPMREILSYDSFVSELIDKKSIVISGGYGSGKTSLLKYLFLSLSKEYIVIMCSPEDIRGKKPERMIKNCFEEIYGDNESLYVRFTQLPKDKKVFLLDNMDEIKKECLDNFLSYVCDNFGYCVFATRENLGLDLTQSLELYFRLTDFSTRYQITQVYADKRKELIEKVVSLLVASPDIAKKNVTILAEAISLQKRFIELIPDFIIKYVEYYCKNIGEVSESNANVFSKVFEMNITSALIPYASSQVSVDKMFTILSQIAYFIHFSGERKYPITESDLFDIIRNYNQEYDSNINCSTLIESFVQSNILKYEKSKNGYIFSNRNYLAYFVAKEINRKFNDIGDEEDLRYVLKLACFGINADILMFISYITDNIRILRLILAMAEEYTAGWEEFDFDAHMPEYLKQTRIESLPAPTDEVIRNERNAEIESEKDQETAIITTDFYDYSEAEADAFINQIIRACALQMTVARCLPNFEHIMKKEDKQKFVNALYTLPNKIFLKWAAVANDEVRGLIDYIKNQATEYEREKKVDDTAVLRGIQWISMSLLLNLYGVSVSLAARDSTYRYMLGFDCQKSNTYLLEHLMVYEKQNDATSFINAAMELSDDKNPTMKYTLLQRIVHHGIVHMESLSLGNINSLCDKILLGPGKPNQNGQRTQQQKALITERSKIINRGS